MLSMAAGDLDEAGWPTGSPYGLIEKTEDVQPRPAYWATLRCTALVRKRGPRRPLCTTAAVLGLVLRISAPSGYQVRISPAF
jgi:hypothetical protein